MISISLWQTHSSMWKNQQEKVDHFGATIGFPHLLVCLPQGPPWQPTALTFLGRRCSPDRTIARPRQRALDYSKGIWIWVWCPKSCRAMHFEAPNRKIHKDYPDRLCCPFSFFLCLRSRWIRAGEFRTQPFRDRYTSRCSRPQHVASCEPIIGFWQFNSLLLKMVLLSLIYLWWWFSSSQTVNCFTQRVFWLVHHGVMVGPILLTLTLATDDLNWPSEELDGGIFQRLPWDAKSWAWKFRYGASGYGVSTIYPYLSIDSQKLTNSNMAMGPFILVPYLFVFSTTRSLFTKNTNFPWLVWPQFFFCNEKLFSFACETIMFDS